MSEQLVVRFEHNGYPVAGAFASWGAYTCCAATLTEDLLWACEDHVKLSRRTGEDLACYRVLRMLRGLGCGFDDWDEERIRAEELERRFRGGTCDVYVFDPCLWTNVVCLTNRNTVEDFTPCANGNVTINLDRKTVRFDSWRHLERDEFEMGSEFKACHGRLIADFDPTGEMGWAEFHSKLLPMLTNKETLAGGHFKSQDGLYVYVAIEC